MTQYKSQVEYQRKKLAAEEWGEQVSYLMAQNGYVEIKKNNGSVVREFRDGHIEVINDAMSIDELLIEAPSDQIDKLLAKNIY